MKCSFLEIYREIIRDLLDPKKNNLKVNCIWEVFWIAHALVVLRRAILCVRIGLCFLCMTLQQFATSLPVCLRVVVVVEVGRRGAGVGVRVEECRRGVAVAVAVIIVLVIIEKE